MLVAMEYRELTLDARRGQYEEKIAEIISALNKASDPVAKKAR